ncbi:ADAMTS-like protein 5 isoform X1 [Sciurus carolinensis]|uniref:ADAMTS-like protein 5 isoform X1 n=1 Tax=Sciurus carolinensis TaxID=30640 RepID=UPI001FB1ED5E|nr:ADAMTS-like protein 5 isoform X1 [Sciurus carolinensis]XP_047386921.1 ADAMTS-like protein 5 isoform X1 [Sciurus carolinensis]XP_047386922.1 ADAMTS-like protein 5 isoform X1 [Sciurus carolinensis]
MGFSVCLAGTRCMGPLCSHRPRPSQSLLLLLWTLLNCVLGSGAQGPGEWTPWGSWSRCSSSCGRGVSVRSRRCIRFPGEESCSGISHEYRLCQLPDCPPGAVPFRDIQCALYNGRPVLGTQKTYQWIPFHGAPNQCDLNCLAEGHAFYHSFGRVLDGTPCSPGAHGLCVAGRCLSAGCDGVLGSGALEDRCGRCGGANDSCLFVQRVFRDAGAFAGYWNVTLIPEGARHIRVAHRSRNHLALMGVDGRYVLNGNWEVSPPGTYEAAGTRVVYARAAAPEETLRATGPTSQDLLLQILLQEPNPGIQFEFWLPRERYGPFQLQTQARGWPVRQRQPQLREVEPRPLEGPTAPPALIPTLAPGEAGRSGWGRQRVRPVPLTAPPPTDPCPPCPDTRGRAHRLLHYCGSDFVFQARVLGRHRQAQETRYEVRIQLIYKNRGPLRSQEYVWAPGHCPCPPLAPHQEYLLAIRRLLSPDGTQDRLLLPHAGYARPWSPAEDSRIRLAARRCPP